MGVEVQVSQSREASGDPARSFLFEVSGTIQTSAGPKALKGGFSKICGLREEIEVVDARDGTDPLQLVKLQGAHGGAEVTLERGIFDNIEDLVEWFQAVKQAVPGYKTNIDVRVYKIQGDRVGGISRPSLLSPRGLRLLNAWPRSYEFGDLDGKSSGVAVESLTLVFETLEIL